MLLDKLTPDTYQPQQFGNHQDVSMETFDR